MLSRWRNKLLIREIVYSNINKENKGYGKSKNILG